MESQSLLPSPKQKNGSPPLVAMISTALLLLGLVFYGGEYWGSHHRASGDFSSNGATGPTDVDLIPFGDTCAADRECVIPPGLEHGNCAGFGDVATCQSGQPGSSCDVDDGDLLKESYNKCVVQTNLDPPHGVCRDYVCQSGKPGAKCGQTSDCEVQTNLDPPHGVCRNKKCQSGKPGAECGQTSDCEVQTGLTPPHGVCRKGKCQQGKKGNYCGGDSDCLSGFCRPIGKCGGSS